MSASSAGLLTALLMVMGSLGMGIRGAIAQTAPTVIRDSSGAVRVDQNAFDIRTGPLTNTSRIPLPAVLPADTANRVPVPVSPGQLAPNSIEIRSDLDYINDAFNTLVNDAADGTTYTLRSESLRLTTQFELNRRPGNHDYGEGISVNVIGPNGVISSQSTFIRGDRVQVGPGGTPLLNSAQLEATYGEADRVELRVLNLTGDRAAPAQSGIYFSADGQFIVEDRLGGGDRDFNDGDYVEISGGEGEAIATEESTVLSDSQEVTETPLDPEIRQTELVETDIVESTVEFDTVLAEETNRGDVDIDDTASTRIGHADGVRAANGQHLVYNRYAAASEVRAGSDGIGITGQLSPLIGNPKAPPTLLTGNLTFNPFVGDNEAGLSATVGITQFFNPTHRQATDVFGNPIVNPDPDGPRLVEPVGLFNNRQLIGYVPPTPERIVQGAQLSSVSGIIDLPADQPIVIEPPDPQAVGRGDSAYTDNVGGLLIERATGDIRFVPQWTNSGYAQTSVSLEAGEAQRIIYALVPQQAGQNLQIGETYAVTEGTNGYQIVDGGFSIISADRQPQNFVQEMAEVYAVEDTLPSGNVAVAVFNGIQGVYAEQPGGPLVPTVDVTSSSEADARVGNRLYSPVTLAGDIGQGAYGQTTLAAGFYVGGSLSGGLGNQRDTITQTNATVRQAATDLFTQRTLNTFVTPLVQRDTVFMQTAETTRSTGIALFDIDSQGELANARFLERSSQVLDSSTTEIGRATTVVKGEERLVSSVTSESMEALTRETIESDISTSTRSEVYPNLSAVQGELALGGVLNFGNTPWTAAANTLRAELFARDTVFGRSSGDAEVGLRAEVIFHPFGEVQRAAYQYDAVGNAIPVYQTEAVVDAAGEPMMQTLTDGNGELLEVPVGQFAVDEAGDRIAQMVGTGQAKGPGVYLRVEDAFSGNDDGLELVGGIQFAF
ncbi:MAG: hypothetical protein WBB01_18940 [Phormidesmis sp.]